MITAAHQLSLIMFAHPSDELSLAFYAMLGLALAASALAAMLWKRLQSVSLQRSRAHSERDKAQNFLKSAQSLESKLRKELDTKREDIKQLKKDLATQRKKTHAAQQESKQSREQLKEEKRLQRESNNRPAFADPEPKEVPVPKETPKMLPRRKARRLPPSPKTKI